MKKAPSATSILFCAVSLIASLSLTAAVSQQRDFIRLQSHTEDGTPDSLDYFFQLLNGLKADDYVPGSIDCSLELIATNHDRQAIVSYFSADNEANRPTNNQERFEEALFTSMRELTENLPSAIYDCYYIPQISVFRWRQHLARFQDLQDFQAGFVQNLLGQTLSILDILNEVNAAIDISDNEVIVYQVGRLIRRVFDFQPMKSASAPPRLQSVRSPFKEETAADMRKLHAEIVAEQHQDHPLVAEELLAEESTVAQPLARQSSFLVNSTSFLEVPYYTSLGFIDGGFASGSSDLTRNVTYCRLNSIRFGNNVTLLAWYSQLRYGNIDKIMLHMTNLITQSYPFAFNCYYTIDEAIALVESDDFLNQNLNELLLDTVYEMRENTDAARRVIKLLFEVYPSKREAGLSFESKEWYALGLNLGVIFNNIANKGNHVELVADDVEGTTETIAISPIDGIIEEEEDIEADTASS